MTLDIPVAGGWEVNLILHHDVSEVTFFLPAVSFRGLRFQGRGKCPPEPLH